MNERKKRLNQKIKVNKQKNQRKTFIQSFPEDISAVIETCEFITSPKLEEILTQVNEKFNYELHKGDFAIRYSDVRKEFSWEHEVISYVQACSLDDRKMYIHLGIGDSPLFLVEGKWVIQNFNILWEHLENSHIWMIGQDVSCGILVSCYLGYLEHDPNPREIIYAVTKWGI